MREYFRHARTIYRAAIRALEANEGAVQLAVLPVSRLALASLQHRFQRAPGPHPFPRSAESRVGFRTVPAPVRICGPARRPSLVRSRAAHRRPAGPTARLLRRVRAGVAAPSARFSRCPTRRWPCAGCTKPACSPPCSPNSNRSSAWWSATSFTATRWTSTRWWRSRTYARHRAALRRPACRSKNRARCSWLCCSTMPARARRTKDTWRPPRAWPNSAMLRIGMPQPDRETVLFLIAPPPGPVERHAVARRFRPADHPRRGPPDGHGGTAEGAHTAHLRRHQRRQSAAP